MEVEFPKLNTEAFFQAVDADHNGLISQKEWVTFWESVKRAGHTEEEIINEVKNKSNKCELMIMI